MKQRVTAILGAIALVMFAVVARAHFRTDKTDSGPSKHAGGTPVVACAPDLVEVCEAFVTMGRIAPGTPTLDLGQAIDPGVVDKLDGWITWDPLPQMVSLTPSTPVTWGDPVVLRSGVLGISSNTAGLENLVRAKCQLAGSRTLPCLGTAASEQTIKLGIGDPSTSEGLVRLAPVGVLFVDESGDPDEGALRSIAASDDSQASTSIEVKDQTQPALGADAVLGPVGVLDLIADTVQGRQRGVKVSPRAERLDVVLTRAPDGADLGKVQDAMDDPRTQDAWAAVGLDTKGGPRTTIDPGGLYQVWSVFK